MFRNRLSTTFLLQVWLPAGSAGFAAEVAAGADGFTQRVMPFFEANCIKCHGPDKVTRCNPVRHPSLDVSPAKVKPVTRNASIETRTTMSFIA